VILAAALATTAAAAPASGPVGVWRTPEDGGSLVRIEPCGDALCGRIVTSPRLRAYPDQTDVRNRDQSLRGRRLRDLVVFKVRPTGPNRWGDGWLYNPVDGGTYKGDMELQNDGSLRLTGCVVAPFCRAQTWRRAD
jgi:uncharacterized protein (DUF2147 family)